MSREAGNFFDGERVDAYLEQGPRMVDFFERRTSVKFVTDHPFADHHPQRPGGVDGGRSLWTAPFDGRAESLSHKLGDQVAEGTVLLRITRRTP